MMLFVATGELRGNDGICDLRRETRWLFEWVAIGMMEAKGCDSKGIYGVGYCWKHFVTEEL